MSAFSEKEILSFFDLLNLELAKDKVKGEIYLVGGAVMCLVYKVRPSTKDVDAYFKPSTQVRAAAKRVAHSKEIDANWLNDSVKGFFSEKGDFQDFLELSNLKVLTASAEYLLAMKCLAMRIGEEFHDLEDVRYLLRYLNIESSAQAQKIIEKYYPLERFSQKTLYVLDELLS